MFKSGHKNNMKEAPIKSNEYRLAVKRSFRNGKTSVALFFDKTAFSLIIAAIIYLTVRSRVSNGSIAKLITITASAAIIILRIAVDREKTAVHEKLLRKKVEEEAREIKIKLDDKRMYLSYCKKENAVCSSGCESLSADEIKSILSCHDLPIKIAFLSPPTNEAERMINTFGNRISLIGISELLGEEANVLYPIREDEIDEMIVTLYGKKRRAGARKTRLSPGSGTKYLLTGGVLTVLSFIISGAMLYRVFASICFGIGAWLLAAENIKIKKPG